VRRDGLPRHDVRVVEIVWALVRLGIGTESVLASLALDLATWQ